MDILIECQSMYCENKIRCFEESYFIGHFTDDKVFKIDNIFCSDGCMTDFKNKSHKHKKK